MKLAFISNFLSQHQIPLCDELHKHFDEFVFVATEISNSQGYQSSNASEYVVDYSERKEDVERIIYTFDVVIFGNCPDSLIEARMKINKLSFLYAERFFKKGIWRSLIPSTRKKVMNQIGKYKNKNMFVLCASAYLPYDLSLVGFPVDRCYKWGYFPKTIEYVEPTASKNYNVVKILWAGRLLEWKHPELAINLAKKLKANGFKFEMSIIGDGQEREKIVELIKKNELDSNISMMGSQTPAEVRKQMEASTIFIATSDFGEGWGAVLNEAMNSGCAVVASHAAGSTPYLVNDNHNGMIFKSGDIDDLYKKIKMLVDDSSKMKGLGLAAYNSIITEWNAVVAAKRFYILVDNLITGKNGRELFVSGPCSKADIYKNNWYAD